MLPYDHDENEPRGKRMKFMNDYPNREPSVSLVPPITTDQLRGLLARIDSMIDLDKLEDTTPFTRAGADSLDLFNIVSQIEMATGLDIPDEDIEKITSLTDLVVYLNARMT